MREEIASTSWTSFLRSLCMGSFGYLICCGLLLIVAVLLEREILPENFEQISVYVSVLTTVLLIAFFAAGSGDRRIVRSFLANLVFLLLAGVGGAFLGGTVSAGRVLALCVLVGVGSILGAIISGLVRR